MGVLVIRILFLRVLIRVPVLVLGIQLLIAQGSRFYVEDKEPEFDS